MILAPTAKRKKVINIDFCMSKFHDLLFLVPKVNNFYKKTASWLLIIYGKVGPWSYVVSLDMTEGNASFQISIYLWSQIYWLFRKVLYLNWRLFKSFLLQLKLIKNSMKVRRDYKWFNSSKFKQIDQCWNKFK